MRRKNTYARAEFLVGIRRSKALLRIEAARYKDPPKPRQRPAVEALRGAVTVLLIAGLEHYLKSAFTELVEIMEEHRKKLGYRFLLDGFHVWNDFSAIDIILKDLPGTKESRHSELKRIAKSINEDQLIPEAFSRTQANPGPETIKSMLKAIGINNWPECVNTVYITKISSPVHGHYVKDKLKEILDRRNEVAHSTEALNISRNQIEEWIIFMENFVKSLDDVLVKHVKNNIT